MSTDLSTFLAAQSAQAGRAPMQAGTFGAANGVVPAFTEIFGAGGATTPQMQVLLLAAPDGFYDLPGDMGDYMTGVLKVLAERRATKIEGINYSLKAEYGAETELGGSGQVFQNFTKASYERSSLTTEIPEVPGRTFQHFLEDWILLFFGDPHYGIPQISTLQGATYDPRAAITPAWRTATMLFYTTDITNTIVDRAVIGYNIAPQSAGENTMRKDLTQGGEGILHNIEWTITVQPPSNAVRAMAQRLHDAISRTNTNPYHSLPAITEISANVAKQQVGTAAIMNNLATTGVPRG